jgi:DNA-binding SARP family transcriptional activator
VQFKLLGPLQIVGDAPVRTPTAPKLRKVLSLLLLNANELVSVSALMEELWGERPPASAPTTLQTYIYQLRRLVEGLASGADMTFLLTRPAGYVAQVADGALDVHEFERRVALGRVASKAGDIERKALLFAEALRLWRGPVCVDVPAGPLIGGYATLLEESRLAVMEERIEADLELGRHAEVIGELRGLVTDHPLRETFHGQLMTALARCGRRSDALLVYQQLRRILVDELGLEPSREIQQLQQAILDADRSLDLAPRSIVVAGRRSAATPAQLPAALADFVGRRTELDQIERITVGGDDDTRAVRLALISAEVGVGKTVLAVHAAHRIASHFVDGQLWAELGDGEADPGEILVDFLRALGAGPDEIPADTAQRSRLFRTMSAGRRLLVVLDAAGSAAQVRPLLPGSDGCAVLITASRQLHDLAGAQVVEPRVFNDSDGLLLLASIVGRERVEREPWAARALCAYVGHLPLALRAAGARLAVRRDWSIATFARRLADENRRLAELRGRDPEITAVLERACQPLSARERQVFGLLCRLPPPYFAQAEAEAALGELSGRLEYTIGRLVELRLVEVVRIRPSGWHGYRIGDLLRLYCRGPVETSAPREEGQAGVAGRAARFPPRPRVAQLEADATAAAAAWQDVG